MKKIIVFFLSILVTLQFVSCSDSSSNEGPSGNNTQLYDVTVTKAPSDAGTISPSADSSYEEGTQISLQATPSSEYTFSNWSGSVDTAANPFGITVDKDYNLTANFQIKSYELTVNTDGEGTVTEQVVQQKTDYEHGTAVELTANPVKEWKFVEWQGDIARTENPTEILIDEPMEVTAVFEKKSYELTTNTKGEGAVSEKIVTAKSYDYGTTVELTANPATGWQFFEWQGDLTGSKNPDQITIDTAKTVTSVFEKKSFAVNLSKTGEGSVTKSPDQEEYKYNSSIELSANAATGWKFVEWQGDISSTQNPLNITVDTTKNVTAVFEKKTFAITVNKVGNGSISKSPDQAEYEYGTTVELTANPDTDWSFEQWGGDISSIENPTQITIDTAKTIEAEFQPKNSVVNVTVEWSELGNVPAEIFNGEQSNNYSTSGSNKEVSHFGVRINYLTDQGTDIAKSVQSDGSTNASISFNNIAAADSVAIYALAVNTNDKAENGSPYAKKLGAIQNMALNNETIHDLTANDFNWYAPSWGTGPDFAESGWDTARVDKSVSRAEIEFYAVNPFDKPYKTGANTEHDGFIMRLSGSGRDGDYQGNNIREYIYVQDHPNSGTQDTVEVEYSWAPYVHSDWFGLPEYSYMIDLKSKFIVIFE